MFLVAGMNLITLNITLDIYSAFVCMTLCLSLAAKRQKSKLWQNFLLMCVFNTGMAFGDVPTWLCTEKSNPWNIVVQWIGALIFWLCSTGMLVSFTVYMIEYLAPKVRVHQGFWRATLVLGGLHVTGILLSLWNGMFFTITAESLYQRGDWFWLSQLLPLMLYALDIMIFINYRKGLSRYDFRILSSYIALPLAGELVQMTYFGISLLPAAVSISLLLIYINIQAEQELRLERQEKELAKARIDIMLSQIQPHFLYNSLTTIRQLCDVNPAQAKETIRNFAQFLRGNMNSLKSQAPIPFEQELIHVENYLALEHQRFQGRLKVVYDIQSTDFSIPPLTLQPIVENAVRHGIMKREEGGTVTIRTQETDKAYFVIVEDDGVGILPTLETDDKQTHIGIQNVRERLYMLCDADIQIHSKPGVGTIAVITIPKEVEG